MNNPKVSVIVPVYKVEPYLEKCLNTLVRQSLREIEIVAVNDGSPDNSQAILERFAREWPGMLSLYEKENGGLSDARNFGLDRVRGDYVAFLDSDDWVDLDLYQRLWERAEETGADVVCCPIRYVWPEGKTSEVSSGVPSFCEGEELKKVFTRFYPAVWNKLYKRELLERTGIRFKVGAWFEDVEFSHRLFPYINRIASVEMACVNYLQREGSITAKPDPRLFDYITNFQSVKLWFEEKNLLPQWKNELEYAACRYLLATFLKRAGGLEDEDYHRAVKEALGFLEDAFPHWRNNPYFWKNGAKGLYLRFFTPKLAKLIRRRGEK